MVPFLFVFSPSLLLQGNDAVALVVDVATAIGGVWLVSAAMIGYLINLLSWPMRALAMLTGILLLIPQELTMGGRLDRPRRRRAGRGADRHRLHRIAQKAGSGCRLRAG